MFNLLCQVLGEWFQGMSMHGWLTWGDMYHLLKVTLNEVPCICHNFISKVHLCNQFCYLIATPQFWFCVELIQIGSLQFSLTCLHRQNSCTVSTDVGSFVNTHHEGSFTHHLKKKCLLSDVVSEAARFMQLLNFTLTDLGNLCYVTWNTSS